MQTKTLNHRVYRNAHRRMALACAVAGSLASVKVRPAQADVNIWSGVTGNWANSAGWSLGLPPANGDRVTLTNLPGAASTLTFDALALPVNLGQLTIDHTVGGSITLSQMDNTLTAATGIIGNYGNGMLVQSGGTHSVGNLYLGFLTAGSSGTVSLGGTGSLAVSGVEVLGYNGSGALNQSGGNHSVGNRVFLGVNDGASGIYNLTGGSASLGEDVYLGWSGSNSSGTLNLSGNASLTVAGHEYVGYAGSGTVNHTGGTHSVGGSLFLGNNPGSM